MPNNISTKEELLSAARVAVKDTLQMLQIVLAIDMTEKMALYKKQQATMLDEVMSALYEYGMNGILGKHYRNAGALLGHSLFIANLTTSSGSELGKQWNEIIDKAKARFTMDTGRPFTPEELALLGGVDIRTVRNAIAASEFAVRTIQGEIVAEHETALMWLRFRRGFIPTTHAE